MINSRLEFQQHTIQLVRRPYQRTLRLVIKPDGQIRLSCRKSTSERELQIFLLENINWLEKTLKKILSRRETNPPKKFIAGEKFPFLGRDLEWQALGAPLSAVEIKFPYIIASGSPANFPRLLRKTYLEKAQFYLPNRLLFWAQEMKLEYRSLKIRIGKSAWGTCSHDRKIYLNAKLMCFSRDIIDYVIIHELAHLVHPNHSKNFWSLLACFCPDYKLRRRQLRQSQHICSFLN